MDRSKYVPPSFVNVSSAFDTTQNICNILLYRLHRIGIRAKTRDLFQSYYLYDPYQIIRQGSKYIREIKVKQDAPQGTGLGPVLSIYKLTR